MTRIEDLKVFPSDEQGTDEAAGERGLAGYVEGMTLAECAEVLAAHPEILCILAALRSDCRVGSAEARSFEEVIRTWTLNTLSERARRLRREVLLEGGP
jgi:hypothetical protein